MDLEILKKKLSTYRGEGGRIRNVPDELLLEVLSAWETWTGTTQGFYTAIGVSAKGMASMMGRAKKLRREGKFPASEFKEITDAVLGGSQVTSGFTGQGIELSWDQGKVIRFPQVEQLIDFLKKVA
jgi:hypothetical protein